MAEKVLFVCDRYVEKQIVIRSAGWKEVDGRAIQDKGLRAQFRRMPYGGVWRGEFLTSEKAVIEALREHDLLLNGEIREAKNPDVSEKDRRGPQQVKTGGQDSGKLADEPKVKAPEDVSAEPPKASVGVKRGRKAAVAA